MNRETLESLFEITGKTIVVTGGGGVLGSAICLALAQLGAKVVVLNRGLESAQKVVGEIKASGGQALAIQCDVLDRPALEAAAQAIVQEFGRVDVLINGAGGNQKAATTSPELSFFDLPP